MPGTRQRMVYTRPVNKNWHIAKEYSMLDEQFAVAHVAESRHIVVAAHSSVDRMAAQLCGEV